MKRIVSLLIALMLLGGIALPLSARAESSGWYQVDSSSPSGYCYLYSAASDRDGKSRNLGRYNNGELVYVMDYYGGQDGKFNYCRVLTQDGKEGYMHDYALTRYYGNAWSDQAVGWYMVWSSNPSGYCYLYSAACDRDGESRNLGRYNNGELVYVLDYYGGQDGNFNYCYVQTQDNKTGYMHDYALKRVAGGASGTMADLPMLTLQCKGTVVGGDANVYTGPTPDYYRTSSGKAYVANGGSLAVYGREGNYYLVQYTGKSNGQNVTRYSFIHVNQLSPRGYVSNLDLAWTPIRIAAGAHMADAPDWSHSYNTISVDRDSAYALAQFVDASGTTWVYFESTGYASTAANQGYVSVRGFVPMSQVSER